MATCGTSISFTGAYFDYLDMAFVYDHETEAKMTLIQEMQADDDLRVAKF